MGNNKPVKKGQFVDEDPEFQMAPMIDVVFQLLIFFMCVTTIQAVRIREVNLPVAGESQKKEERVSPVVINLQWAGENKFPIVSVNNEDKTLEELTPFLRMIYERNKDMVIWLRADKLVRYHQVRDVMKACSKAGFGKIHFVTVQSDKLARKAPSL